MSFRQYACAVAVALFSPVTRLLPRAVLETAGFSGWLAPLPALAVLLGLVWVTERLLTAKGRRVGLADALVLRLGPRAGRAVAGLLVLWLLFYGGVVLRSGGERILSTVYPTSSLGVFLGGGLLLGLVFALGRLRWAGRCAAVTALFFAGILVVVFAAALPAVHWDHLWPPDLSRWPELLCAGLAAANVLSPWVWFGFLRGGVTEDGQVLPRAFRGVAILALLTLLFLFAVVGGLGPELALRQQFPFYVMIKNLRLFHLLERFDAVIVVLWMMTDEVFLGMLLLSAGTALWRLTGSPRRGPWVLLSGLGMLLAAVLCAGDAFRFARVSERLVPAVNLGLTFVLLPLICLFPVREKYLRFCEIEC